MATSQNDWPVHTSAADLVPLSWITGRVVGGDVHAVFDYLCARFDAEVEPIHKGESWGWAYRPIRGSLATSNHASGTAIDLNAPAHPLGHRGTFTDKQVAAIHAILRDLDGAVRWGGDYSGRPDEMHFEIDTTAATLRKVAADLGDDMFTDDDRALLQHISKQLVTANTRIKRLSGVRGQLTKVRKHLDAEHAALVDEVLAAINELDEA